MIYKRRQPETVNAIQYQRELNISSVQDFFDRLEKIHKDPIPCFRYQPTLNEYGVITRNKAGSPDLHILSVGEWIVRTTTGGPYNVLSDQAFHKIYERMDP